VKPSYLKDIARELRDPRVGLVANVIAGSGEETLGAAFENLHLCSFVAGAVCMASALTSQACVIGKSMLFKRSDFERLGGWRSVRNMLAEDFVIGHRFARHGYTVAVCSHVIETVNRRCSVRHFLSLHLRWGQMRRRLAPNAYLVEPFGNPIPWLGALAARAATSEHLSVESALAVVTSALVGIAVKCGSDAYVARQLRGKAPALGSLLGIPFKDLLVLAIWVVAAFRRRVVWRDHVLWVGRGSRLSDLHAPLLRRRPRPLKQIG
jgi:ceramide glucosyltransferase